MVFGLITPCTAESYQDLLSEMNRDTATHLRAKILKLPKKSTVEVTLKSGKVIRGTLKNFVKYDDGFWIMPLDKSGWFADEAYDLYELLDVRLIVLRPV